MEFLAERKLIIFVIFSTGFGLFLLYFFSHMILLCLLRLNLFQLLINPCFNFFTFWPLMICKSCLPLTYALLNWFLQPISIINSFDFIQHLKFIFLLLITLFVVFFIRIKRIPLILLLLLVIHFSLLLFDRLLPIILKLLNTLKANVEIQAFQIVSSTVQLRLLVAVRGAEPLAILLVGLILSVELFPKGLRLWKVEVKTVHRI